MAFEFDFNEMFRWASLYMSKGLMVIRLHGIRRDGSCTCGKEEHRPGGSGEKSIGKHPVATDWINSYARDEDDLLSWDDGVPFNIGVILGATGGVIDAEDDSPEAAAFRESIGLDSLVTPTWTSGKSTHQLMKWDERLGSCKGVMRPGGLECRLGVDGQVQSVMPPSWHRTGVQYAWKPTMSIDDVEIAEPPKSLLVQLINGVNGSKSSGSKTKYEGPLVFSEVHDGQGRHHRLLLWSWNKIINDRFPLDPARRQVLTQEILDANEKYIKPPKSRSEVLQIANSCFEHYRKKEEAGWRVSPADITDDAVAKEAMKADKTGDPEDSIPVSDLAANGLEPYQCGDVMAWKVGTWRIQMIKGDPTDIRLIVPQWINTPCEGKVDVSLDTYMSPAKMGAAIFHATQRVVLHANRTEWEHAWLGIPASKKTGGRKIVGVMEQLLARKTSADDIHVGASGKRFAQVAAWFQQAFAKATEAAEEKPEPNPSGRPCWVNGELWFQWGKVTEEIGGPHNVTQADWRKIRQMLLDAMGAQDFPHRRHSFAGTRREFVVFTPEWIKALENLSVGDAGYTGNPDLVLEKSRNHSPSTVTFDLTPCTV